MTTQPTETKCTNLINAVLSTVPDDLTPFVFSQRKTAEHTILVMATAFMRAKVMRTDASQYFDSALYLVRLHVQQGEGATPENKAFCLYLLEQDRADTDNLLRQCVPAELLESRYNAIEKILRGEH